MVGYRCADNAASDDDVVEGFREGIRRGHGNILYKDDFCQSGIPPHLSSPPIS
jgi:hypothetical protein